MFLFFIIGLPIVVTYAMTLIYEKGDIIGNDISKLPYLILSIGLFTGLGILLMQILPKYGWWSGKDYDDDDGDGDEPDESDDGSFIKLPDLEVR